MAISQIKLALKSWTSFTKFLTACQYQLIINGTLMICWKKCGYTCNWFECKWILNFPSFVQGSWHLILVIQSPRANFPTTNHLSYCTLKD